MKEVLLLKCGEIVLKGLNRKTFEDRSTVVARIRTANARPTSSTVSHGAVRQSSLHSGSRRVLWQS